MTTGLPYDNSQHSEVLDLMNPDTICEQLSDHPIKVGSATGSLLSENNPIICGGNYYDDYSKKCHIIGKNAINTIDLIQEGSFSSVVLHDDTLWITGRVYPVPYVFQLNYFVFHFI